MQFRNTLLVAASAAVASATETVYLVVKSDNSAVNGNTLGFSHEGAGIDYVFLGTAAQSEDLTYDSSAKTLASTDSGFPFPMAFGFSGNYVQVSVESSTSEFTFDGNTLEVNGTSTGFYACENTNDPYNYSQSGYELMYYSSDAPSDCIAVTLEKSTGGASSGSGAASSGAAPSASSAAPSSYSAAPSSSSAAPSSAAPSSTVSSASPSSSSSTSVSTAAGANFTPAGAFALLAGVAAALI